MREELSQQYLIWWLLSLTYRIIMKLRKNELREYGISPQQSGILFLLASIDHSPTPVEISRKRFLEEHSVSVALNRMLKLKLIKRTRDTKRKNMWRIQMTEKGQRTCQLAFERKSIQQVMSPLSEKEMKQLKSILEKLKDQGFALLGVESKIFLP